MKQFLFAHSANKSTKDLLKDCIEQLGNIPAEASLGFIYISDLLLDDAIEILDHLKHHTGLTQWVGSVGMGLIATQQEYYNQKAIVIMVADFNEADFHILPNITETNLSLSDDILTWCNNNEFTVGLTHGDPDNPELQSIIRQLGHDIPRAFLVGGISSSHQHTLQFANAPLQGGMSGVLFSPNISILSNLSQGCTPIGSRHRVTDSENNVVRSLDNKPALDVLLSDAGQNIARDWTQSSNHIFVGLINKNTDVDDYTVRQLMGIDPDNKAIAIADFLEHDQEIVFCRRDANSATEDMQRMLEQLKSRITSPIKGAIYISCMGRGREQFGINSEETRLIHSVLGDFPLIGFFANGEIHKNLLYGFTGVLTLFS
ncbi:hypothetical protein MNBD_GAMMA07-1406 [hydrothermal vent metagenome]|uniref:Histidine kinase n=1 Tax=hydrothermal vent metagenome TaxID=652676 RepID=A0A3B0WJ50_9ZZZZ